MIATPHARTARWIVLLAPAFLLGGAYIGQYVFGLYPCEMCWWQRYPHFIALALAMLAFVAPPKRLWVALAALAIVASGLIGGFHAGVEYGWWQGVTGCAKIASSHEGGSALDAILATPLIRCDQAPWSLLGVSLAGYNFLISAGAGLAALVLLATRRKAS
ncbi:disulfide bond formation protein B [Alteriqipengyuania sp. 357]